MAMGTRGGLEPTDTMAIKFSLQTDGARLREVEGNMLTTDVLTGMAVSLSSRSSGCVGRPAP